MTSNPSPVEHQPIITNGNTVSDRIESLDVLRGIAVLLALFVSIWVFGGFISQYQNYYLAQGKGWNHLGYVLMEMLLDGKMRAIIAIVFGAAMIIFLSRKDPSPIPWPEIFIRRQLWLIVFGVINAIVFLWTHDILFHLGVMGVLLFPFARLNHKALLIGALLMTFIYSGKNIWQYDDREETYVKYLKVLKVEEKFKQDSIANAKKGIIKAKDSLNKMQKDDKGAWEGMLKGMTAKEKKGDPGKKAIQGNYDKAWDHLMPNAQFREARWTYQFGIWDLGSMILLGMGLFKIGFFSSRFPRQKYLLIGITGLIAGLLFAWYRMHYQQVALVDFTKYIKRFGVPPDIFFPFERAFMGLGYVGIILYLLSIGVANNFFKGLACVGKLSLSNYVFQTLACTILFYGYGMGYYGRFTQFQLYIVAAEIILVQVIASVLWMRYYTIGPVEWLLRRLSYGSTNSRTIAHDSSPNPSIH